MGGVSASLAPGLSKLLLPLASAHAEGALPGRFSSPRGRPLQLLLCTMVLDEARTIVEVRLKEVGGVGGQGGGVIVMWG